VFVVRLWLRAIEIGTDTECYLICCEVLGRAIERGSDTEY